MDKKIYFTFLVVLLLAGGYWLFRCLNTEGCPTPKVTYPEVVYVGDDVWFTDSTEGATHSPFVDISGNKRERKRFHRPNLY